MHAYNLRSRVNSPATNINSIRGTPNGSLTPSTRNLQSATGKIQQSSVALQLDHVIGTTTKSPGGLASCTNTNSFAYCAGSVAVLAQIDASGAVSHRYYRARPAAVPINPTSSVYTTPTSTPTRKRRPLVTPRKDIDGASRVLLEDESARTWTQRERIKSVRSVALSPNGRWLAVGESGYSPRVLLFSTARDASTEVPFSIVTEHTWGIRNIAFSPDGRFLATLGESNDGFLFIWSINHRSGALKLWATNKCTTNVCHMIWCGQHLLTVGTRHVKIWQLPTAEKTSPSKMSRLRSALEASPGINPIPLYGRNCLLGDLADLTFTCAVSVTDHIAVISTDTGSLCFVDVSKNPAELSRLDQDIGSARALGFRQRPQRLVWAGGGDEMHELDAIALVQQAQSSDVKTSLATATVQTPRRSTLRQSLGLSQLSKVGAVAVVCLLNQTISIDAESNLVVSNADTEDLMTTPKPLSSHNVPVQGVQALPLEADLGAFFTWSKSGEVRFWASDGHLTRVEQIELDEGSDTENAASNELKILRYSGAGVFISGDRFGVLKLTHCKDWDLIHLVRAHSAEINDVCIDCDWRYVATCSRDRMVQVFQHDATTLDLIQTTDDHIASVNQLTFSNDGNILLSCSSDRTIVVREKVTRDEGAEELVAFLQMRIITIKASPVAMALAASRDDLLYVSATDRQITKIDLIAGTVIESFKVAENDTDDHAVLNSISVIGGEPSNPRPLLVGCSSTDKSVRIYDLHKQIMLCKESAHTEGISDVAIIANPDNRNLPGKKCFVSTGHDSTIMVWTIATNQFALTPAIELTQEQATAAFEKDLTPAKATPNTLPPLRKMLTKLDIAEFVKNAPLKSPSTREPSPARLRKKGSRPALRATVSASNENVSPALTRRASTDERAKAERRSPSPPAYATRRHQKPSARGQITKDFYTRQSEWLRRSPSPIDSPTITNNKSDAKANRTRLRRPPSVPTDLRAKAAAQERRPSTVVAPSDGVSLALATEQACRILKNYKKKIQSSTEVCDLTEIELELDTVLELVRSTKKQRRTSNPKLHKSTSNSSLQRSQSAAPKLRRQATWTTSLRSPQERHESSSPTGSEANSPTSGGSQTSLKSNKDTNLLRSTSGTGLGVEGLSILMEKAKLAEV